MSRPTSTPRRRRSAGFTLVEIMVVVVIIGLLAAIIGPNVFRSAEEAELRKAKADLRNISDTVKQYMILNRGKGVPTLEDLTTPDDRGTTWLENMSDDPWGNPYELRQGDSRNDLEVISWGPNGQEGDEDDLSSKRLGETSDN